jgi:hypothetical protein
MSSSRIRMMRPAGTSSISAMRFTIFRHFSRIVSGIGGSGWWLCESKTSFRQGDTSFTSLHVIGFARTNHSFSVIQRFLGSNFDANEECLPCARARAEPAPQKREGDKRRRNYLHMWTHLSCKERFGSCGVLLTRMGCSRLPFGLGSVRTGRRHILGGSPP